MRGYNRRPMTRPLLVIGVHRSELAFGDRIAARLGDEVDLLRIDRGLSGAKPTPETLFRYNVRHAEMYRQVLQTIGRRDGLVIDLHTGINELTRCADVYCHDERFLSHIGTMLASVPAGGLSAAQVRPTRIVANGDVGGYTRPIVRTCLPEKMWRNRRFLYVGVEVYLVVPGAGDGADEDFAAALVRLTIEAARCAM